MKKSFITSGPEFKSNSLIRRAALSAIQRSGSSADLAIPCSIPVGGGFFSNISGLYGALLFMVIYVIYKYKNR